MSSINKPFILIASVRRTGSTVLSEALSQLPHSLILHEPYLAFGHFIVHESDRRTLAPYGIDLLGFKQRWRDQDGEAGSLVPHFKEHLLPHLAGVVRQVGVKEIRLLGWQSYRHVFPDLRIVLTGRDPRDIYISLYHRYLKRSADWSGDFTPDLVAHDLLRGLAHQMDMYETGLAIKVRYEDLCDDPETVLNQVKNFTENDVPGFGPVGRFLSEGGRAEHDVHGGRITSKRTQRWKHERDPDVLRAADRVFELMQNYRVFWEYD